MYGCERDSTNLTILNFSAMTDLLEKKTRTEFCRIFKGKTTLSAFIQKIECEKVRVQVSLSTVLFNTLLRVGSISTLQLETFERLDGTKKEKHSGIRNNNNFATVLFFFCSVMPFPRKLDQIILFVSLSHSPGGTPLIISLT